MLFISQISPEPEYLHQLRGRQRLLSQNENITDYDKGVPAETATRMPHFTVSNPPGDSNKPVLELALNLHPMVPYHFKHIMNSDWL